AVYQWPNGTVAGGLSVWYNVSGHGLAPASAGSSSFHELGVLAASPQPFLVPLDRSVPADALVFPEIRSPNGTVLIGSTFYAFQLSSWDGSNPSPAGDALSLAIPQFAAVVALLSVAIAYVGYARDRAGGALEPLYALPTTRTRVLFQRFLA